MTPIELLETVKLRFTPLLHDEDTKLRALLVMALTAYQDRAGHVRRTRLEKSNGYSIALPKDYLELVCITDQTGDWIDSEVIDGAIEIASNCRVHWPLTMEYLVQLSALDLETADVPNTLVGILQNYLEALIAIPNYDRLRRVSIAGKLDVSNLPDEATLYQRKIELEAEMSARCAIPRGAVIYSGIGKDW